MKNWLESYPRAFHAFKFLSLMALNVEHSFGFVNRLKQIPVETIAGSYWLESFLSLGTYFILLAGISFALSLNEIRAGRRLSRLGFGPLGHYLVVLNLVDMAKDLWLYELYTIFAWTFLKTLLVGYMLVRLLGWIHLGLIPLASLGLIVFRDRLTEILNHQLVGLSAVPMELQGWTAARAVPIGLLVAVTLWASFRVWAQSWPRPARLWLIAMISFVGLKAGEAIFAFEVNTQTYLYARNWWVYAIAGRSDGASLYSLLAWLPTLLNGFTLGFLIQWPPLRRAFERAPYVAYAAIFLPTAVLTYYYVTKVSPPRHGLIVLWYAEDFVHSSTVSEILRILFFTTVMLTLVLWARVMPRSRADLYIERFSRASFPVYLVYTSFTFLFSHIAHRAFASLFAATSVTIAATFIVSVIVVNAADWVRRKRFRVVLTKVKPDSLSRPARSNERQTLRPPPLAPNRYRDRAAGEAPSRREPGEEATL